MNSSRVASGLAAVVMACACSSAPDKVTQPRTPSGEAARSGETPRSEMEYLAWRLRYMQVWLDNLAEARRELLGAFETQPNQPPAEPEPESADEWLTRLLEHRDADCEGLATEELEPRLRAVEGALAGREHELSPDAVRLRELRHCLLRQSLSASEPGGHT